MKMKREKKYNVERNNVYMKNIILIFTLLCVLTLFAGCSETPKTPDISDINGKPGDTEYLMLDISGCESAINVTATGCESFEGITDRIKGTDISGGIIKEVSTCADFGSMFSGWYDIEGVGAKSARYTMRLEDKQEYEEISLGINYYSLILEAKFFDATSVEIEHGSDITVNGLTGDFELTVFVLDGNDWLIGTKMTIIKGKLDVSSTITLYNNGNSYTLESDTTIRGLSVEGYENNENILTQAAETATNSYTLTFADGKYVWEDNGV